MVSAAVEAFADRLLVAWAVVATEGCHFSAGMSLSEKGEFAARQVAVASEATMTLVRLLAHTIREVEPDAAVGVGPIGYSSTRRSMWVRRDAVLDLLRAARSTKDGNPSLLNLPPRHEKKAFDVFGTKKPFNRKTGSFVRSDTHERWSAAGVKGIAIDRLLDDTILRLVKRETNASLRTVPYPGVLTGGVANALIWIGFRSLAEIADALACLPSPQGVSDALRKSEPQVRAKLLADDAAFVGKPRRSTTRATSMPEARPAGAPDAANIPVTRSAAASVVAVGHDFGLAGAAVEESMVAALIAAAIDIDEGYAASMRDDSQADARLVFRVAEHTVLALGAGNVRDALFALARRGLIRRVGDDVEVSSVPLNAILRHVRRGEPHDSWHYRAIEHACGNITHIEPEEARRVLARMEKSFTLATMGVEKESRPRAVRTAGALLAMIARAQRRVTPSFSNDYPMAAVHLARVGAFDEALTVLRTYAVARNERYGENDHTVARTIVMGFALEAGNHDAFAACLRDGLHLFLQRRGKERRAAPLLDQWLRQGIQASVESGVTDLVRRTMDEVLAAEPPLARESIAAALQSLLPDDSDAVAQAKAEAT